VSERVQEVGTQGPGEASARLRGSFLGFVAHEVRNPLSTALWSAELLARLPAEERSGPRGEKLAGMCLRALKRLRILVEDHFLAERLDASGLPIRCDAVPVREVIGASQAKVESAGLSIEVEEGFTIFTDGGLFERAIDGLIAVAGRGDVPVHLHAAREGDSVVVRVRGCPPEPGALDLPHKGTASDPTGRGLALHMVQRVARALGGSLSTSPHEYLLSLPLSSGNDPGASG